MRFPLGTDGFSPEFYEKQAAIPTVDCDLFFASPDVYFVPQAAAGKDRGPNRSYRSGRLSCREVEK